MRNEKKGKKGGVDPEMAGFEIGLEKEEKTNLPGQVRPHNMEERKIEAEMMK